MYVLTMYNIGMYSFTFSNTHANVSNITDVIIITRGDMNTCRDYSKYAHLYSQYYRWHHTC